MVGPGEKRVALVIGNAVYKHADTLRNPANDAKAIGAALTRLGFSGANPRLNLDQNGLLKALKDFARDADGADMAVIYFAGHGVEVDGRNSLIPVDAKLERSTDVEYETLSLDQALNSVNGAQRLRLIILDACRNNPFRARMWRSGGTRSIGRGLRSIEPSGNILVAYAAKHGTVALDGKGDNSPFAEALRDHIEKPGLEIGQLFREVRDDVLERTRKEQEPYIYGTLGREGIYLKPFPAAKIPNSASPSPPQTLDVSEFFKPPPSVLQHLHLPAVASIGILFVAIVGILIFGTERASLKSGESLPPEAIPQADTQQHQPRDAGKRTSDQLAAGPELAVAPAHGFIPVLVGKSRETRLIEAGGGQKKVESFKDCSICPELVIVPAGTFIMGSSPEENKYFIYSSDNYDGFLKDEGPAHRVTIQKPFAVAKFEITNAEFAVFLNEMKTRGANLTQWVRTKAEDISSHLIKETAGYSIEAGKEDFPVAVISWYGAKAYVTWLSQKTDFEYRLLSEAEWEYATRAGTQSRYFFGDDENKLDDYAWYAVNSVDRFSVGAKRSNDWGMHDLHGSVWEWVEDCWSEKGYLRAPIDGTARLNENCNNRVIRGGSWDDNPNSLRSTARRTSPTNSMTEFIGFRVARAIVAALSHNLEQNVYQALGA